MTQQKLYTEEQVRNAIRLATKSPNIFTTPLIYSTEEVMEKITPIELPSDEEIVKELFYQKQVMNPYPTIEYSYTAYEKGFMDCANLIIDKIKGGNK